MTRRDAEAMDAGRLPRRPTVSAGFARALVDFSEDRGAPRARLLTAADLVEDDLADADARVAFERFIALMRAAKALTGDPALALAFGAESDFRRFSIAGLIAHASSTMAEALVQLNRYGRLVTEVDLAGDGPRFEIVHAGGRRWMLDRRADPAAFPELTESTWSRFICWTRREWPDLTYALSAEVSHPAPEHAEAYERIWRIPVRFSAGRNAIETSLDWGEVQVAVENRYAFGVLIDRGEALLADLESRSTFRGRVEALLLPILHTGEASVEVIARRLNTSRRTVWRSLKAEGATFAGVLDDLRRRMALDYLAGRKTSVQETAYLVGFSDAASFSRAFKRWTGRRPGAILAATSEATPARAGAARASSAP